MNFKSTHEILKSIIGRTKPDLWQRVSGIPEFNPITHSDGCSGGMTASYDVLYAALPSETRARLDENLPWHECCVVHDRAYYYGGTREEKLAADEALKKCVAKILGDEICGKLLGSAMESAVTIGGVPYFKTSYRWGYGEDFRNTEDLPANDAK